MTDGVLRCNGSGEECNSSHFSAYLVSITWEKKTETEKQESLCEPVFASLFSNSNAISSNVVASICSVNRPPANRNRAPERSSCPSDCPSTRVTGICNISGRTSDTMRPERMKIPAHAVGWSWTRMHFSRFSVTQPLLNRHRYEPPDSTVSNVPLTRPSFRIWQRRRLATSNEARSRTGGTVMSSQMPPWLSRVYGCSMKIENPDDPTRCALASMSTS